MSTRNPSVIYESQTLTEEQKATVCENIGAQPAVSGKSLSTNDYTNEDQSKLQGIDAGADVNTIESISVNGIASTPDADKNVDIDVPVKHLLEFLKDEESGIWYLYENGENDPVTFAMLEEWFNRNDSILLYGVYDVLCPLSDLSASAVFFDGTHGDHYSFTDYNEDGIPINTGDPLFFDLVNEIKVNGNEVPLDEEYGLVDIPLGTGLTYDSTNGIHISTTGTATGANSFAEGVGTSASAQGSHAEGGNTRAKYSWAHAEGYNTEANGNGAHAEGVDTNANEQGAHAGGYGAHTTGVGNFIHGTFLNYDSGDSKNLVKNLPTVVLGTLNATQAQDLTDHGGYLIIVGNGDYIKDGSGTRRDGFILYKDGTVKATAFQNASGTDNNVGVSGGAAFSGISNIEVFDAIGAPDPANFPNDNVLRIILES